MSAEGDAKNREDALRKRLTELGLTLAEFRRRSGLSRNVVYRLSKGGAPNPEQADRMNAVLQGERPSRTS